MRIDISFLPALAATFLLVFARVGAMMMLLPGFGEASVPVRLRLGIALLLTLILLPLHRDAYHVDLASTTAVMVLMVHEIIVGVGRSPNAIAAKPMVNSAWLCTTTEVRPTGTPWAMP